MHAGEKWLALITPVGFFLSFFFLANFTSHDFSPLPAQLFLKHSHLSQPWQEHFPMSLLLSQSRSQVRNTGQESINPLRMASRSRGITAPHCHLPPRCTLGRLGGPSPRAGPSVCLDEEWGGCTEWVPHAPFSPSVSTTVSHCGWDLVGAMEDREAPWASDCRTCSHSPELLWAEECRSSPFSAWVSSQARLAEAGCFPQTPAEQSLLSCTVTPHFKDASSFFFSFFHFQSQRMQ